MNALLALDLGSTTGWAACYGDTLRTGVFKMDAKGDNRHGQMFAQFHDYLHALCAEIKPQAIIYEDAGHAAVRQGGPACQLWFGWRAVLLAWCAAQGISEIPVKTTEYKRLFGLNSMASKDEVRAKCESLNIPVKTYDEADAVAVLNARLDNYGVTLAQFKWRGK